MGKHLHKLENNRCTHCDVPAIKKGSRMVCPKGPSVRQATRGEKVFNVAYSWDRAALLGPKPLSCALCGKVTSWLVSDHDHSQLKVRDWICTPCNTGLGMFGDSIGRLQQAIEYLERHK